ncbi:phage baseplate assembly protein [Rhodopseudomonas palustris]|uniref:phage baseplate assembly protein n=1 Tax=Rhodopseudomonas palustris TaxID=1076 RepID=UPI000CEB8C7D|nr:hypothetical protein [Rhodopseudomonas palustris]PPQ42171.1 hypothetical protein CKO39_18445 [Rhodopseudomonas palustris]
MGPEVTTIVVGGTRWSAFEKINVHAAFNEAARSFSFEVAAEMGASATNRLFIKGTPVKIYANADLLLDGQVDKRQAQFDGDPPKASITVTGRSKSADLIDGSAEHETGSIKNKTPDQIGNEVCKKYAAKFRTDQQLDKVEKYQVTPGESVFRCVEKLARQQGMTLAGRPDGDVDITKAGSKRHAGGLIEGFNIKGGSADHDGSNQHSEYIVRGQRPSGHGEDNLEVEAREKDETVKRHRPVVIVQDEDTDKKRAKKRAKNRKERAAGDALKATIRVQGFRDEAGTVWTPGWLIWTESPFLDIAQDMLIESVDFDQDDGGSIATLGLTDPRSYGGEDSKGNKSGEEWKR